MRSAKIHSIDENEHWAEYAELQRPEEEDKQISPLALLSWCVVGGCMWVFLAEIVRAIIRWPYWSAILR